MTNRAISEKRFENLLDGDDARCTCERAQVVLQPFNYGCSWTPLTSLFEKIYILLVLQKIEANTIQISKTAARPLRGSKSFYHFLMPVLVRVRWIHGLFINILDKVILYL
jgi:hypothetical protein